MVKIDQICQFVYGQMSICDKKFMDVVLCLWSNKDNLTDFKPTIVLTFSMLLINKIKNSNIQI